MKNVTIVITAETREQIDAALDQARRLIHKTGDWEGRTSSVGGYPFALNVIADGMDDVQAAEKAASRFGHEAGA